MAVTRQRPTSPPSSTVSYEHDDFAVIQYGPTTSCDNGVTSCSSDRRRHHHQHVRPLSQNLTWPQPSDDKLTTPTATIGRCLQPISGPPCFQDGGQCPLDAASYHCRRCSAALRDISQSVCCSQLALYPADVTSGSDGTSGVSHVTGETEREPVCSNSQDTADSRDQPPPACDQ